MLHIQGTVLGVETRTVDLADRPSFQTVTVHVLSGWDKFEVRASRDSESFARQLGEGEEVDLPVGVSAFPTRSGGAGFQLTLLAPESTPARG